jgi:hypothetical protein
MAGWQRVLTLLRGFFFRDTRPLWEMGLGAFIAVLLAFAAMHLAWLAVHFGQTTLIILVLAACYALYLIRHVSRLAYGMVEIAIGMFAIFGAMGRAPEVVSDPSTGSLLLVQMAAGMYVVIRGFDNFAQAQPFKGGSAPFRGLWRFIRGRWGRKRAE